MPNWAEVVSSLVGRRVLVVGDVMLDEYIAGDARRVCPEAPVPMVEVTRRWALPGGAANAAANVAALGGCGRLCGVVGADPAADELARACYAAGLHPRGFVRDRDRPTTVKLRVLARNQQVIRADTESTAPIAGAVADQLVAFAGNVDADAILLSDYAKGVLAGDVARRVIARAGRPVVVDPKGVDPSRYRGAFVVKPNLSELGELTGLPTTTEAQTFAAGERLAELLPESHVLLTRGADGMVLFRAGTSARTLSASPARRVFDVTGAGDTAAATLALCLAAGHPLELAARVANAAAGVVVGKVGTASVAPGELLAALGEGIPDFAQRG